MAYSKADPTAVQEGIESGLEITTAQSHKFLAKLASNGMLENLKNDSPKELATKESTTVDNASIAEHQREATAAFDF
jgi:hypothetical protein